MIYICYRSGVIHSTHLSLLLDSTWRRERNLSFTHNCKHLSYLDFANSYPRLINHGFKLIEKVPLQMKRPEPKEAKYFIQNLRFAVVVPFAHHVLFNFVLLTLDCSFVCSIHYFVYYLHVLWDGTISPGWGEGKGPATLRACSLHEIQFENTQYKMGVRTSVYPYPFAHIPL